MPYHTIPYHIKPCPSDISKLRPQPSIQRSSELRAQISAPLQPKQVSLRTLSAGKPTSAHSAPNLIHTTLLKSQSSLAPPHPKQVSMQTLIKKWVENDTNPKKMSGEVLQYCSEIQLVGVLENGWKHTET